MNQINPAIRVHDFEDCTIHTFPYQGMDLTIADYLIAAFSEAEEINVLVGYFRVSFFQALAPVLAIVYHSKKQVKIICGHQLSDVELRVLYPEDGSESASAESIDELVKSIWNTYFTEKRMSAVEADVLVLLHHLIDAGQVQVKPVFVKSDTTSRGLFHQKEYLFKGGDWLSRAVGSANMTASGVSRNSESLDVRLENLNSLRSNTEDRLRFAKAVWAGDEENHVFASKEEVAASVVQRHRDLVDGGLDVEEVSKRLFERVRETCSTQGLRFVEESPHEYPVRDVMPIEKIELRKHQEEAIKNWHEWGNVGLFEMATGAGKTITAIRSAWELAEKFGALPIVVLVPSKALIDQWYEEFCSLWPDVHLVCSSGSYNDSHWRDVFGARLRQGMNGVIDAKCLVLIGVYSTILNYLRSVESELSRCKAPALLIADECHSAGAAGVKRVLNRNLFGFRIGLSATPQRYMDEEGTQFVLETFDGHKGHVYRYGLADAIRDEYLCPYQYHVYPFILDEASQKQYIKLTESISRLGDSDAQSDQAELKKMLLIKRARLITKSPAKMIVFEKWLDDLIARGSPHLDAMLVFAPEGFGEEEDDHRVIDEYLRLFSDRGIAAMKFIGGDGQAAIYDSPLKSFSRGSTKVLLAMKCLDEGVDLPRASCGVFLASTGNAREHIQRRGRLLRLHDSKECAEVIDFMCYPHRDQFGTVEVDSPVARSIIQRELARVKHFLSAAENELRMEREICELLNSLGYDDLWEQLMIDHDEK